MVLVFLATTLQAGQYHGSTTTCSDCHTQHNSEQGAPMRLDKDAAAAPILLKASDPLSLCLQCHDGKPDAPDVVGNTASTTERAAGFFHDPVTTASDPSTAHQLGVPVDAPWGGKITLTCVSCHDPHANTNYRNLKLDPRGDGTQHVVTTGQLRERNEVGLEEFYGAANVRYKQGMTGWCQACHPAHDVASDHPLDRQIFGATGASFLTWQGVPAATARVPVQTPTNDTIAGPGDTDDQVFCLSCHKAHGSSNYKTLLYPDGVSVDSACEQCHTQ